MTRIKTLEEIQIMHEGGKICSQVLVELRKAIKSGITTLSLDTLAGSVIKDLGAQASFKKVEDYKHATCINVNSGIVHGIPNNYVIQKGDILSIDLGVYYKGFHTDLSYTLEVEMQKEEKFLQTGRTALQKALDTCVLGNKIGDVSYAMQHEVEKRGYTVSEDLVGHGIGHDLHEDPYVPCCGKKNTGVLLKEGMVLAVEVIYQKGKPQLTLDADGWTLKTLDGSISGLYENTVAILKDGPLLITHFD